MNKYIQKASVIALASLALTVPALALESSTATAKREEIQQKLQERKTAVAAKLSEVKLEACQKREASINKILTSSATQATKQVEVFNKISERTQAFYTTKGRTVENYDALVAEVTAKKAAAEAEVETLKSTSVEFACDGTDPKGAASLFKDAKQNTRSALKEYKTAVKNLIVAVKSAQGSATSTENSGGTQ